MNPMSWRSRLLCRCYDCRYTRCLWRRRSIQGRCLSGKEAKEKDSLISTNH